jgi:hypothetical protein
MDKDMSMQIKVLLESPLFNFLIAFLVLLFFLPIVFLVAFFRRRRRHARAAPAPQENLAPLPAPPPVEALVSGEPSVSSPAYGLFLFNPVTQEQIPVGHLPAILGRGETSTLRVNDPTVSMTHARLSYHPVAEKIYLEDLHSTNGLWVNGKPTALQLLENEDQIRVGQTTFTFQNTGYLHPAG